MNTKPIRKKLIEVALPLEAINIASAREKSIRHGHPSTLHLWWARRPLASARAVIFSQMVDDPSEYVDVLRGDAKLLRKAKSMLKERKKIWDEAKRVADLAAEAKISAPAPGPEPELDEILAEIERERLFEIIRELVLWENTTNEAVLQKARDAIWESWRRTCAENVDHPKAKELFDRNKLPAFHDPFAGGGALPLEAQRLGLESYASDLNPVAVLINKAMIEIPPKFADKPPINPEALISIGHSGSWKGAQGLGEDVRYYGQWMRDEAEKRLGHLYPKVKGIRERDGNYRHATSAEIALAMKIKKRNLKSEVEDLTVIAWIWARTVKSPNPAFVNVDVPLISTFLLSTKVGNEAYIEPVIEDGNYHFTVKSGNPIDAESAKNGTKLSRGANFKCIMSGTPMSPDYIKAEGVAGRMGAKLMAIVADGERGRAYFSPTKEHEEIAVSARPEWEPEPEIAPDRRSMFTPLYGMTHLKHLFTQRQLAALTVFSDLAQEVRGEIHRNGAAQEYANAVATYLAFAVDKCADYWSSICTWHSSKELIRNTFGRQAIPMTWDYVEANPMCDSTGNWMAMVDWTRKAIVTMPAKNKGIAQQSDASTQLISSGKIISTDPPYYDNIGYADLSDFFYVWLRRSLKIVYSELFSTLAVPKDEELVATPYRHGNKEKAEKFFLEGMTQAMHRLAEQSHPVFPVTIYYAFKQAESESETGTASTGWETFLDAVLRAGFAISGTWPMRTELGNRMIGKDTNALASSIVLVCRRRSESASSTTRREFHNALKSELPLALLNLQRGNIAPVDLAQAAIGPGMGVFTRYAKVLDAEGKALTVREALALINQTLDETLAEQEGDFDPDTRWALTWFDQQGFDEGEYGVAEQLSKSKNTSVAGMVSAGILHSKSGKVRLLKPEELPADWTPEGDTRLTVWEMVHFLVRDLGKGETAAATLVAKLGAKAETARELAYRLYAICERRKRAAEALSYNALVQSWPEVIRLAQSEVVETEKQGELGL